MEETDDTRATRKGDLLGILQATDPRIGIVGRKRPNAKLFKKSPETMMEVDEIAMEVWTETGCGT